jgi:methylaspartate ammonia-lyase
LSVLSALADGTVASDDGVSIQYAGTGGREPVLDAIGAAKALGTLLRETFVGADAASFRASSERLARLEAPSG